MNPWFGILKKEFRLSRMGTVIALLAMVLYIGFSFYISWKTHSGVLLPMSWTLILGHILYLPLFVAFSFNKEKHTMHLWLHNPQSGHALIAAKFLNGFAALCISLLIACSFFLFSWWTNQAIVLNGLHVSSQDIFETGIFVLVHIFLLSIYFALWGTLLTMVDFVSKQKIGKLRYIIFVIIILFGPWTWQKFEGTSLYYTLTHWGPIQLSNGNLLYMFNVDHIYIGTYIFHTVIAALLFFLSSWMLDRKVEV